MKNRNIETFPKLYDEFIGTSSSLLSPWSIGWFPVVTTRSAESPLQKSIVPFLGLEGSVKDDFLRLAHGAK